MGLYDVRHNSDSLTSHTDTVNKLRIHYSHSPSEDANSTSTLQSHIEKVLEQVATVTVINVDNPKIDIRMIARALGAALRPERNRNVQDVRFVISKGVAKFKREKSFDYSSLSELGGKIKRAS